MSTLQDRIEQHCRTVWPRTWDTMPEHEKAWWRVTYSHVIEAQMRAEEQRP